MNTTTPPTESDTRAGALVLIDGGRNARDRRGTVLTRGEAIRRDYHAAQHARRGTVPIALDGDVDAVVWYRPDELVVLNPGPPEPAPPADDVRVTVDHLAGMSTGRPLVTIKFTAPRELFDAPVEQWRDIALAEATRLQAADKCRRATELDAGLRARGL